MNTPKHKNILSIMLIFFIFGVLFLVIGNIHEKNTASNISNSASVLLAQEGSNEYVPLVSNVKVLEELKGKSFTDYLKFFFRWGLIVAIGLSIIMITVGGIQYMTTDAVFDKSQGKERIWAAIAGLILALSAWMLLNTINPTILKNPSSELLKSELPK